MPENTRQSIAQMRASGQVRQARGVHTICLDAGLAEQYVAKREELATAYATLEDAKANDPGRVGGTGNAVSKAKAKAKRLAKDLDVIAENMAAFEVEVGYRRHQGGEWNRFVADHPPRTEAADEYGRRPFVIRDIRGDQQGPGAVVDFDALVDALPEWVDTLNGEPLTDEDWGFVADNASPGDLDALADKIIVLHTQAGVAAPKSVSGSLSMLIDAIDSKPPETGRGRRLNGSTAGNPPGSPSTSTTTAQPEPGDSSGA